MTLDSPKHPAYHAAVALSSGLERAAQGRFVVEGEKLVSQALAADALVEAFVVDEPSPTRADLERDLTAAGIPWWTLAPALLPRLIGTRYATRLGAVGVVRRTPLPAMPAGGLLLVAEQLQDPRNVGVLVRTAEAAGLAAVAFSDSGADPYSRPAVRSTTGSLLRQPVHLTADVPGLLRRLRRQGVRVVASSARAKQLAWDADLTGDVALVVGNETEGLSAAASAEADATVALPVAGGASSLNVTVATGALVYEALRQRRRKEPRR